MSEKVFFFFSSAPTLCPPSVFFFFARRVSLCCAALLFRASARYRAGSIVGEAELLFFLLFGDKCLYSDAEHGQAQHKAVLLAVSYPHPDTNGEQKNKKQYNGGNYYKSLNTAPPSQSFGISIGHGSVEKFRSADRRSSRRSSAIRSILRTVIRSTVTRVKLRVSSLVLRAAVGIAWFCRSSLISHIIILIVVFRRDSRIIRAAVGVAGLRRSLLSRLRPADGSDILPADGIEQLYRRQLVEARDTEHAQKVGRCSVQRGSAGQIKMTYIFYHRAVKQRGYRIRAVDSAHLLDISLCHRLAVRHDRQHLHQRRRELGAPAYPERGTDRLLVLGARA